MLPCWPKPSLSLAYTTVITSQHVFLLLPLIPYCVFCYRLSHIVSLLCSNPQQLPGRVQPAPWNLHQDWRYEAFQPLFASHFADLVSLLCPLSLWCTLTGLLALLQSHQTHLHLPAFEPAVPPAQNTIPLDINMASTLTAFIIDSKVTF